MDAVLQKRSRLISHKQDILAKVKLARDACETLLTSSGSQSNFNPSAIEQEAIVPTLTNSTDNLRGNLVPKSQVQQMVQQQPQLSTYQHQQQINTYQSQNIFGGLDPNDDPNSLKIRQQQQQYQITGKPVANQQQISQQAQQQAYAQQIQTQQTQRVLTGTQMSQQTQQSHQQQQHSQQQQQQQQQFYPHEQQQRQQQQQLYQYAQQYNSSSQHQQPMSQPAPNFSTKSIAAVSSESISDGIGDPQAPNAKKRKGASKKADKLALGVSEATSGGGLLPVDNTGFALDNADGAAGDTDVAGSRKKGKGAEKVRAAGKGGKARPAEGAVVDAAPKKGDKGRSKPTGQGDVAEGVDKSSKTADLRRMFPEYGWLGGDGPPPVLPPVRKTQWSFLLDEVSWMALDFRQELRSKLPQLRHTAQLCANHVIKRQMEVTRNKQALPAVNTASLREVALGLSTLVRNLWRPFISTEAMFQRITLNRANESASRQDKEKTKTVPDTEFKSRVFPLMSASTEEVLKRLADVGAGSSSSSGMAARMKMFREKRLGSILLGGISGRVNSTTGSLLREWLNSARELRAQGHEPHVESQILVVCRRDALPAWADNLTRSKLSWQLVDYTHLATLDSLQISDVVLVPMEEIEFFFASLRQALNRGAQIVETNGVSTMSSLHKFAGTLVDFRPSRDTHADSYSYKATAQAFFERNKQTFVARHVNFEFLFTACIFRDSHALSSADSTSSALSLLIPSYSFTDWSNWGVITKSSDITQKLVINIDESGSISSTSSGFNSSSEPEPTVEVVIKEIPMSEAQAAKYNFVLRDLILRELDLTLDRRLVAFYITILRRLTWHEDSVSISINSDKISIDVVSGESGKTAPAISAESESPRLGLEDTADVGSYGLVESKSDSALAATSQDMTVDESVTAPSVIDLSTTAESAIKKKPHRIEARYAAGPWRAETVVDGKLEFSLLSSALEVLAQLGGTRVSIVVETRAELLSAHQFLQSRDICHFYASLPHQYFAQGEAREGWKCFDETSETIATRTLLQQAVWNLNNADVASKLAVLLLERRQLVEVEASLLRPRNVRHALILGGVAWSTIDLVRTFRSDDSDPVQPLQVTQIVFNNSFDAALLNDSDSDMTNSQGIQQMDIDGLADEFSLETELKTSKLLVQLRDCFGRDEHKVARAQLLVLCAKAEKCMDSWTTQALSPGLETHPTILSTTAIEPILTSNVAEVDVTPIVKAESADIASSIVSDIFGSFSQSDMLELQDDIAASTTPDVTIKAKTAVDPSSPVGLIASDLPLKPEGEPPMTSSVSAPVSTKPKGRARGGTASASTTANKSTIKTTNYDAVGNFSDLCQFISDSHVPLEAEKALMERLSAHLMHTFLAASNDQASRLGIRMALSLVNVDVFATRNTPPVAVDVGIANDSTSSITSVVQHLGLLEEAEMLQSLRPVNSKPMSTDWVFPCAEEFNWFQRLCQEQGIIMDPFLHVHPLQSVAAHEIIQFPSWQRREFDTSYKRLGSETSLTLHYSPTLNGARVTKRTKTQLSRPDTQRRRLSDSGLNFNLKKHKLSSAGGQQSRGYDNNKYPFNIFSMVAKPSARNARETEGANFHWSPAEEAMIVCAQHDFNDPTYMLTEFALNCALASGSVQSFTDSRSNPCSRSARQARDRLSALISQQQGKTLGPLYVQVQANFGSQSFMEGLCTNKWANVSVPDALSSLPETTKEPIQTTSSITTVKIENSQNVGLSTLESDMAKTEDMGDDFVLSDQDVLDAATLFLDTPRNTQQNPTTSTEQTPTTVEPADVKMLRGIGSSLLQVMSRRTVTSKQSVMNTGSGSESCQAHSSHSVNAESCSPDFLVYALNGGLYTPDKSTTNVPKIFPDIDISIVQNDKASTTFLSSASPLLDYHPPHHTTPQLSPPAQSQIPITQSVEGFPVVNQNLQSQLMSAQPGAIGSNFYPGGQQSFPSSQSQALSLSQSQPTYNNSQGNIVYLSQQQQHQQQQQQLQINRYQQGQIPLVPQSGQLPLQSAPSINRSPKPQQQQAPYLQLGAAGLPLGNQFGQSQQQSALSSQHMQQSQQIRYNASKPPIVPVNIQSSAQLIGGSIGTPQMQPLNTQPIMNAQQSHIIPVPMQMQIPPQNQQQYIQAGSFPIQPQMANSYSSTLMPPESHTLPLQQLPSPSLPRSLSQDSFTGKVEPGLSSSTSRSSSNELTTTVAGNIDIQRLLAYYPERVRQILDSTELSQAEKKTAMKNLMQQLTDESKE